MSLKFKVLLTLKEREINYNIIDKLYRFKQENTAKERIHLLAAALFIIMGFFMGVSNFVSKIYGK